MNARHFNPVLQYALILSLSVLLVLGQAFKLHIHVMSQSGATPEQISKIHIASMLHNDLNQSDSQMQNQNHTHFAEVDLGTDGFVKKIDLLVLGIILLLIGALLLRRTNIRRLFIPKLDPDQTISSLLYLVIPPLRAPPRRASHPIQWLTD